MRTFKHNATGKLVTLIDHFEDVAILDDKSKERMSNLTNPILYTEVTGFNESMSPSYSNTDEIDVNNFFNNQSAYNSLAEKIKNIPTDHMVDEQPSTVVHYDNVSDEYRPSSNESAIIHTTKEDEMAELARKYNINPQEAVQSQNAAFDKILNPEKEETSVQQVEAPRVHSNVHSNIEEPMAYRPPVEDPIVTMFKNVKRNTEFSISIDIHNKIPRLDFIEMMEDSYNTSIIDYLASEFTEEIIRNPKFIEDLIKDKIKELVYGDLSKEVDGEVKETKKTTTKKDTKKDTKKSTKKESVKKETKKEVKSKEVESKETVKEIKSKTTKTSKKQEETEKEEK